jgi:F0F1-type ATP synthase assembly protein I
MPFNRPIPESKSRPKSNSGIGALVQAEKLMQIALLLPSSACIGWLLGAWADRHFHQSWIGIAGALFGGVSGLIYVIRLAQAAVKDSEIEDQAESENEKESPKTKP